MSTPPRTDRLARLVPFALVLLAAGGCAPSGSPDGSPDGPPEPSPDAAQVADADSPVAHDTLTTAEREAGWRLLFDGETLEGWRQYASEAPPEGWRAEDGTLHRFASGGDIMTVDTYDDYELALEWKVSEGGNSGIFYHGRPGYDYIHDVAPEMQVLDDAAHPDGQNPLTSAGAVYGLYPAPRGLVNPAGEWNQVRIVVRGSRIEHWLNGEKIADYELGSEEWQRRVADSKFSEGPEYGSADSGHIGLQDHGDPVWYRNIRLRPLDGE